MRSTEASLILLKLIIIIFLTYSSAIFRRVTPPAASRAPQQEIHQNVRLDREWGAMYYGDEIPIFPNVIPKKPADFSIGNEWGIFQNFTVFRLSPESPSSPIRARRNVIQTLKWRKTCLLWKNTKIFLHIM